MACNYLKDPLGCAASDTIGAAAKSAWDAVCASFAEAAVNLLEAFAKAFVAFPPVDVTSGGIRSVYGLSLGVAAVVTGLVALLQIGRTAFTHEGAAAARAFIGVGKILVAFVTTLTVAGTSLLAADELTVWIIERSFGDADGLRAKLAGLTRLSPALSSTLLLIISLVCIVLVVILWFQMLARNAATAAMIATAPIAAAGMASETTKQWFSDLVWAVVRLIVLKPVIAMVFAVGFGLLGNSESEDLISLLTGMTVLLIAVLAWPAIGRFFTFARSHVGGPTGLAALIGAGANATNAGPGIPPGDFSQQAEARTMTTMAGRGTPAADGGGGAAGGSAAAIPMLGIGLALAQRAANALVGQSEQMAGHAGLSGVNPHAQPAGHPRYPAPGIIPTSRTPNGMPPQSAGQLPPVSPPAPALSAAMTSRAAPAEPPLPAAPLPTTPPSPTPSSSILESPAAESEFPAAMPSSSPPPPAPMPPHPVAPHDPQGDTPA
ncbi:hypothetical protein [Actinoplanes regularis]|uniref:TrbL/VirB6 plasmid conjugal transfer protein n=1 Tax=Actinoplanes regularis TaxID=52697 RepID=A0A238XH59_9ACTN|nr:hypothetical protein [Actinoplanes regularis]GIE86829.1 hypothetical protein Are01nite_33090 [Actinoplanes regularis]SNR58257.1 hypothetical protein SAMN06264365_103455 [Actinoplanes regularis]